MNTPINLSNVHIWTGDQFSADPTSLRVDHGRVESIHSQPSSVDCHINGRECWIVPGFIDAHMHLLMGGETLDQLDLAAVSSRDEFEAKIAQRHMELPDEAWLIAGGWSEANFVDGGAPDASWLASTQNRPAIAFRMDRHAVVVNEVVMSMIDIATDPPGGRIVRDPKTKQPNGLFVEAAAWNLILPLIPSADIATRQRHLLNAQHHCHAMGLTMVGSMEYQHDVESVFLPLRDQLTLRTRVTLLDRQWPLDTEFGLSFNSDAHLSVIGYKAFIDGTLGSRTARMLDAYRDDPANRGLLVELALNGHLTDWARHIAEIGLSPSMHAIGDEAVRRALDAADAAQLVNRDCRPRIEHAQQIAADDVNRFTGRVASMQPLHKADDGRFAEKLLGTDRLKGTFAFRRLLEADAILAFGSDWPVVSCDPMLGLQAAITGKTLDGRIFLPDQNLTPAEAIRSYTIDAATALGADLFGRIFENGPADLVVLDRNPLACDWESQLPEVLMTIAAGRIVWSATELPILERS